MPEDQAIGLLHAVLARPEFQTDSSLPWWQQLLAPVLNFVWGLISQLWQLIVSSVTGREGSVGIGVLALAVLLLAAGVLYLVRALRLSIDREAEVRAASLSERRERSDQLWQAAQKLAAAGEFADAVRLAYLSALYALDERAVLHLERSLTNREHAQRLRSAHPRLADTFGELVERYERVRYGRATVAADAFADFSGQAQQVRSAALGGPAA